MPAVAGLAGLSTVASAADCSTVPDWDGTTLYSSGDRVQHPDSDGVATLWEAAIDSRNAEPSQASAYWDAVGDCGGGGSTNEAPTASFTTDMSTPAPGDSVTFDASGSSDADGSISSYSWAFGDGATASGQTASHSYSSTGDYTVTLTVTDDDGATGSASTTVSVSSESANAAPNASFTVSPASPTAGESATFDAADSSDSDGSISAFSWELGDGTTTTGESVTHSYESAGDYTVTLTVTDDDGATDSNATTVTVQESGGGEGVDCSGIAAYDPSATYTGGDQVTYDGSLWTSEWWTSGTAPAESENVWTLDGGCGGGSGGGNEAPTASFTVSPVAPEPGEQVTFDAGGSSDPDGDSLSYDWQFGDGATASGDTAGHTYDSAGDYTVTLTVSDGNGNSATDTTTLSVATDGGSTASNRIVGYWMQWSQYDREYTPGDIPTDKVTHLQYAFMAPEPDGTISGLGGTSAQKHLFPESWHDDITTFGDISANTDVTCLISIGGWSDSENFSDVALNESSRQKFADECVRIVREAGVDGVDIDWEYPGGGGHPDNTVRDGDQERFTKLIQACRDALDAAGAEDGEDYKLTAAMVAGGPKAEGLDHGTLSDLFDFVSIMTFDMRGGFSDYTGHASPLFQNPNDPSSKAETFNVDQAMSWYVDKGWDPEQLNMATPFYGRSFADVQPPSDGLGNGVDDGLFQNFSGTGEGTFPPDTEASGIYDYWDLSTVGTARATSQVDLSSSNWTTSYDDTAKAAWSYNQSDSLMISHPTPDSVQTRASWLANSDYGGTMIWALSHDTVEHHLLSELANGLL